LAAARVISHALCNAFKEHLLESGLHLINPIKVILIPEMM
jgi:hypothetical protein